MKTIFCLITLFISSIGCTKISPTVDITYFKNGDVVCADYALPEDILVIDAIGLNKSIALIEQGVILGTDEGISNLFYKYCKIIKK